MKYAKPGKFKHAVKELLAYIDAGNGVDNLDEWREEIDNLKLTIDPKDRDAFEKIADRLEIEGLILAEAYQYMEKVLQDFQVTSHKIITRINNEKSKKSNR